MRRIIFWWILALWAATVFAEDRVVIVLGRTGDGKSSLANMLAQQWDIVDQPVFAEGASPTAHTAAPQSVSGGGFTIVDTPGLMDPKGSAHDEANMVEIVKYTKQIGALHGFIVIVNEEVPRLDDGMQNALRLLVDTFGPTMLDHLAIVFTRSYKPYDAMNKWVNADERSFRTELSRRIDQPVPQLFPLWQVELRPDLWKKRGSSDEWVASMYERNQRVAKEIHHWLETQSKMDVSQIQPAEYLFTTRLKALEAEEARVRRQTPDASKNQQQCEHKEIGRSDQSSPRYGSRCIAGVAGGRKYRDHWTVVRYRVECRTLFHNREGEFLSATEWKGAGEYEKEQDRRRENVC
jgi:GTP-binding protein EngB required for normal cell division